MTVADHGQLRKQDPLPASQCRILSIDLTGARRVHGTRLSRALNVCLHLQRLGLSGTDIDDSDLRLITGLKQLQYLSLANTAVSDSGLIQLGQSRRLQTLDLTGTLITDRGLSNLAQLTQLQSCCVADCKVSQQAVKKLKDALPDCEISQSATHSSDSLPASLYSNADPGNS